MQNNLRTLNNFRPRKVLVIGDVIIDRYHVGVVNRISQEAPIPILRISHEKDRLGGAGSLAQNLSRLGCQVSLCALTGCDDNLKILKKLLIAKKISTDLLINDDEFSTLLKARFLAQNQQILRVDYEKDFSLSAPKIDKIVDSIIPKIQEFSAVAISHYVKGFLQPLLLNKIINETKRLGIPCVCDPGRGVDHSNYKGITTIKPNRLETEGLVGFKLRTTADFIKAATILKKQTEAEFILISLDEDGIFYYRDADDYKLFMVGSKEIFDVCGAGDMVIAILTAFLANKQAPIDIIPLANIAAGIVISRLGTASVSLSELMRASMPKAHRKIISLADLIQIRKNSNQSWSFTNGHFDNLTSMHIKFLQNMAKYGDFRVVAINSDQSIKKQKGRFPEIKQLVRAELLASLSSVDWVVIFDEDAPTDLIKKLKPDWVIKGKSHLNRDLIEQRAIDEVSAKLEFVTDVVVDR
ncbi:MAG: bifunctional heptose 7-phosphate kinase/heptose 1-phosphate adenyltransferase [SAR324 cluster bacterium]|nr:bifunctional heptose 7-phosphate kinase/heptose 1-phosphate adenyltransferase [SAR324 cluster bacterium]